MNTKTRVLIATPLVGLAAVGGCLALSGVANAGTLPMNGNTVAMTIYNNTNQTMTLTGDYTDSGDFIAAPQQTLAPHSSEIVTASTANWNALTAIVNYGLPNTNTIVTFQANNTTTGANTDGTTINGTRAWHYNVSSQTDTGFPNMNAAYYVNAN